MCSKERAGSSPALGTRELASTRGGIGIRGSLRSYAERRESSSLSECTQGRLAQLVRASRLHREGRGFESLSDHIHFLHAEIAKVVKALV